MGLFCLPQYLSGFLLSPSLRLSWVKGESFAVQSDTLRAVFGSGMSGGGGHGEMAVLAEY